MTGNPKVTHVRAEIETGQRPPGKYWSGWVDTRQAAVTQLVHVAWRPNPDVHQLLRVELAQDDTGTAAAPVPRLEWPSVTAPDGRSTRITQLRRADIPADRPWARVGFEIVGGPAICGTFISQVEA